MKVRKRVGRVDRQGGEDGINLAVKIAVQKRVLRRRELFRMSTRECRARAARDEPR